MEGILFKWTNYISGWQQRYFALKDGVLSYYRSPEEVSSGCKGSVNISACDVIVHSSDPRRFDLHILGDQRFYLRALSQVERQRWVVAIGSCKAGLVANGPISTLSTVTTSPSVANKRSELRLYRDLLVQQVSELRGLAKEGCTPDVKRMDEVTSLVNATCSTFLATLDELMSNLSQSQSIWHAGPNSPSFIESTNTAAVKQLNRPPRDFTLTTTPANSFASVFSQQLPAELEHSTKKASRVNDTNSQHRAHQTFFSTMEFSFEDVRLASAASRLGAESQEQSLPADFLSAFEFVSACRSLFSLLSRLPTHTGHSSPHTMYTGTTAADLRLLTNNASGSLQQVIVDLASNLRRLELATALWSTTMENGELNISDTGDSTVVPPQPNTVSIGVMIRSEVEKKRFKDIGSSYLALLWVARSLNFAREFIHELFNTPAKSPDETEKAQPLGLSEIATAAYSRTLRPFHQWSVRGMAMLMIMTLPSRYRLLQLLLLHPVDETTLLDSDGAPAKVPYTPDAYAQLKLDAVRYSRVLGRVLTFIEGLFASLDLERVFTGMELS